MNKKLILLGLAAVSAVLLALPAVASATAWEITPANGVFPANFTVAGGQSKLTTANSTITCASNSAEGRYDNKTTGTITKLTFHGCTAFGFNCTTAGQPAGTITATVPMVFHNITLEPEPNAEHKRGILITPKEITNEPTAGQGHFATFVCGGLITVKVSGNGIVGEITAPNCGVASTTGTLSFESSAAGVQKWMQTQTTGTKFDLVSSQNGGAHATSSEDAEATITFGQNMTQDCT